MNALRASSTPPRASTPSCKASYFNIKVYLQSVYAEQSIQPMRAVCDSEQVEIESARKIIDQARSHGYLTRVSGAIGGTVTDKAKSLANLMMLASAEAKKESK